MSKIIMDNRSSLNDVEALGLVGNVMKDGRISSNNKQYCYLTVFNVPGHGEVHVSTDLNKRSDRFVVYNSRR